jgi:hypothetical protein
MTAEEIIEVLEESRPGYDENECWEDWNLLGMSAKYIDKLGNFVCIQKTQEGEWDDTVGVWYFADYDVYIKGKVRSGSHGAGYALETYTLQEVRPKKIEVTIYE